MRYLRQSTAVDVPIGPFLDATDGVTAETALTISQADVRLKKNNGAWAQVTDATAATHEENGWYEKELDATDTNTVGTLVIAVHESGALPVWHEFTVLEEAIYDALFATSANAWSGAAGATTLTALAAGSITASVIADNAIDAGAIAADAITAAKVAADVSAEIADAVWDEDATGHQTGGTFGQAIGDPGADTTTIYQSVVTDAAGTNIAADIIAIEAQTDDIGVAGAGLTAVPWNAAWDAEVQSEVQDAIVANHLDHFIYATGQVTTGGGQLSFVDTARTESVSGSLIGMWVTFVDGDNAGFSREISGFTSTTDTVSFNINFPFIIDAGDNYIIWSRGAVDVGTWNHSAVNSLISGRVDASVGAMAAGVVTAAAIATDAIDADALAADAIAVINATVDTALTDIHLDHLISSADPGGVVANNSFLAKLTSASATAAFTDYDNTTDSLQAIRDKETDIETDTQDIQARLPAALVSGRIDASVGAMAADTLTATAIAADAITAAKIATGAIDADALATDAVAEIADGVWDEATSGHVTAGTFGQRLYTIRTGTAQAGDATTITLDASASATDDFYNSDLIVITGGTGAGQARFATDYVGATKVATVATWATNPSSDSVFEIIPFGSIPGASAPTATEVADAVLTRNVSNVEASMAEHTLGSVILATMEFSIAGTTWTIKRTDGSTTHLTKTLSTDADAEPIVGVT